jgi:hypothetical protein
MLRLTLAAAALALASAGDQFCFEGRRDDH